MMVITVCPHEYRRMLLKAIPGLKTINGEDAYRGNRKVSAYEEERNNHVHVLQISRDTIHSRVHIQYIYKYTYSTFTSTTDVHIQYIYSIHYTIRLQVHIQYMPCIIL